MSRRGGSTSGSNSGAGGSSSGGGGGASGGKGTSVSLAFDSNLRSSLAHLPPSMYHALVARDIPPQSIVLQIARPSGNAGGDNDADADDEDSRRRDTVYLGWSGQCSNTEHTLTVSSSLGRLFQPAVDTRSGPVPSFTLTLLRSPPLPTASRVDLTPLTPDDWEILSQNAGAVEDNMLSQVRGVHRGGRVCIFVNRSECWFRVDSTEPQTAIEVEASARDHPRAVRLTTNTEVVIAPRVRQSHAEAAAKERHDIASSSSPSTVNAKLAARAALKHRIYKVAARRSGETGDEFDIDGDTPIAVISPSSSSREWDLLSTAFASSSSATSWLKATIQVQACPSAPTIRPAPMALDDGADRSLTAAPGSSHQPTTTAYVVRGGGGVGGGGGSGVSADSHSPSSHRWVYFNAALRAKLGGRIGVGETFCFSAPPPGTSATAPPPTTAAAGINGKASTEDTASTATSTSTSASALTSASTSASALTSASASTSISTSTPTSTSPPTLAGITSLLSSLSTRIDTAASTSSLLRHATSTNLLLYGSSGTGKTSILRHLCAEAGASHSSPSSSSSSSSPSSSTSPTVIPLYVDCTPLSEMRTSQLKTVFTEWRDALDWYAQGNSAGALTILMLDNLDRVVIPEVENVDPSRARAIAELFVDKLSPSSPSSSSLSMSSPTMVIATANSNTSTHKLLVEKHFWNDTVGIKSPGKAERAEILAHLVKAKVAKSETLRADAALNYIQLSSQTEGYLPADLVDLVDRAIYRAAVRVSGGNANANVNGSAAVDAAVDAASASASLTLTPSDFASAQENFTPLSLRSLSLSSSTVSWSSVGGLTETRRVLRETLEFPSRYAQIFASCPLRLRSGLLLYGYPGCGKTMLASAVAKECGANFVSVKGPEILNKYIGASEKSVRDLFERASAAKPCVLFFDEFDSIAPKRGHDSTGVTDRVVNQLLTQMDGAEGLSGVYVLAATSRPDLIDSALLRPGRLDKSLLCDMPSGEDRVDILRAVVREGKITVAEDVRWDEWSEKLQGFSGADLQAFVYNAHLEVVHEGIAAAGAAGGAGGGVGHDDDGDGDTAAPLRFVELSGEVGSTSDSAPSKPARSGAEEQALRRRVEMALANSRSRKPAKPKKAQAENTSADDGHSSPSSSPPPRVVTNAHLQRSLASMRPSVPESERARLQRIYRDFAGERSTEFKSGEGSRSVGARESLM